MDHYSIFEPSSPEKDKKEAPPETAENTSQPAPEFLSTPAGTGEIAPSEAQNELAEAVAFSAPVPPTISEPMAEGNLPDLDAALQALLQKAQYISNATGAAIALRQGADVVCRAASGSSAPDRGAKLQIKSGLTAECLRSGELLRCDNVMLDPRVDLESCKRLGIESIIITPIRRKESLAGVLELFSSHAYSFQERDVETVRVVAEEIGKMLDRGEETVSPLSQAVPAPAFLGDEASAPEPQEDQHTCSHCGGKIVPDTVFCTECGSFQEGAPGNREAQPGGWKSRITGRRMLVPAAFVAMALLVAVAPIPRTSNRTAQRVQPFRQAALTTPVAPAAQSVAQPVTNPVAAPAAASTPMGATSSATATNPGIAKSVKQLLGGVSSDFSKLLPVNEKAEPPSNGDPTLKVWVDTRKGFYYCPGDEQYGRTGKGSYMTQKQAESNYYIPALIKPCM